MSPIRSTRSKRSRNEPSAEVTGSRRRRIVELFRDGPTELGERELAEELATDGGRSTATISRESAREVHVALRHVDLPALDDAGLVAWDRDDGTVAATEQIFREDAVPEERGATGDRGDDAAATLDERRRAVLSAIESRAEPVVMEDLARAVVATDGGEDAAPDAPRSAVVRLHHVDLPKLDEAGLVEYDSDEGTVVRT